MEHPVAELLTHERFADDCKTVRFSSSSNIVDVKDVFRTFLTENASRQAIWRNLSKVPQQYVKWSGEGRNRRVVPIGVMVATLAKMPSPEAKQVSAIIGALTATTVQTLPVVTDEETGHEVHASAPAEDALTVWTPPPVEMAKMTMVTDPLVYGSIWNGAQASGDENVKKRVLEAFMDATESTNKFASRATEMQLQVAETEVGDQCKQIETQGAIKRARMKYDFLMELGQEDLARNALSSL